VVADGFDVLEPVEVTAPAEDVRIQGAHLGTVRLRLQTPDGSPPPESVFVWRVSPQVGASGGTESVEGGLLTFGGWRGTTETLEIHVDGYVHVVREVTAGPGDDIDLGTAILDPGKDLVGRVVDGDGKPVAGASIAFGGYEPYTQATSGSGGAFRLAHVPGGTLEVSVDAEGFLPAETRVDAEEEATLVLRRGAVLHGVVTDGAGKRLGECWVEIFRPGPVGVDGDWVHDQTIHVLDDGSYEARVAAGPCRIVRIRNEDRREILANLNLVEGETRTLDLVAEDK